MHRIRRLRIIAVGLIFSFMMFYSPYFVKATSIGKGNLTGFIYEEDGTTPVESAVVKMRNIYTGSVYESQKSSDLGLFKLESVDEGLYIGGITTKEGNYNIENLIGIRAQETARVSFALKSNATAEAKEQGTESKKKGLAGFFLSPAGVAVIVAASVAIVYTIVKLTEEEPEASPFKK